MRVTAGVDGDQCGVTAGAGGDGEQDQIGRVVDTYEVERARTTLIGHRRPRLSGIFPQIAMARGDIYYVRPG